MNKNIMWLIIGVIVAAMGIVLGSQYFNKSQVNSVAGNSEIIMPSTPRPDFPRPNQPSAAQPQPAQETSVQAVTSEVAQILEPQQITPPPGEMKVPSAPVGALEGKNGHLSAPKGEHDDAGKATRQASPALPHPPAIQPATPSQVTPVAQPPAPETKPAQPAASKPAPAASKPAAQAPQAAAKPATTAQTKTPPATPITQAKPIGEKKIKTQTLNVDGAFVMRLVGSEAIRYQSILLNGPDRLVIDLPGKWDIKAPGVPKNKIATNVRIGQQPDKTRIVVDLSSAPGAHNVTTLKGNTVEIRVRPK